MKLLAIETSCDETAAAVVEKGRHIRSNVVASQIEMHALYGGVVPELASRKHIESISQVVDQALDQAQLTLEDLDGIAVTYTPGLIGALLVGVNFAKALAFAQGLPLIPVHHVRGHIASNYLSHPSLEPPFFCLCVSGGTTALVDVADYCQMGQLGSTRDDAVGECFDKVARVLGLGYPGGGAMDRLASGGEGNFYPLPRAKVEGAPLDLSFSGLKTACLNLIHRTEQRGETLELPHFAASLGQAVADSLVPRCILGAKKAGRTKIAVAGGVAANSLLRQQLAQACKQEGFQLFLPDLALCGDNGAMIGAQAYYEYQEGRRGGLDLNAFANGSLEQG